MVEIRSWRISSSRALRIDAPIALKVSASRPISSLLPDFNAHIVVALADLRRRAIQRLHRLQNPPRQQVGEREAQQHRRRPQHDDICAEAIDSPPRGVERA